MSAATLMGGLSPAQWRALNALFYAGHGGMNVMTLKNGQRIEWQQLVDLEAGGFVVALFGRQETKVKLADIYGAPPTVRAYLLGAGRNRCVNNRANQVICTLGGRLNHAARVRDCKGEGMADDNLLSSMGAAGLIIPDESGVLLSTFKRLPRDLVLRLTPKGRLYFPLDMVGASA